MVIKIIFIKYFKPTADFSALSLAIFLIFEIQKPINEDHEKRKDETMRDTWTNDE